MALLSFTIFPIVSDAVEGIHATIDTREYHSPSYGEPPGGRQIADIDPPLLNRILTPLIHSFQVSEMVHGSPPPQQVIQVNQSHQDYVFGPNPAQDMGSPLSRILGPSEGSESSCLMLPLAQIQRILKPTMKESKSCRDCSSFE
jgi:hypothetical protein